MQSTMNFELINDFNAHEIEKMCPPAENRSICACFMFIDKREFNQMTSIPFPHLIYLTCSVVSTAHVFFLNEAFCAEFQCDFACCDFSSIVLARVRDRWQPPLSSSELP